MVRFHALHKLKPNNMKDYKQLLADGWVITHDDGTTVIEAHQWLNGSFTFKYSDGLEASFDTDYEVESKHTLTPPANRVKTWHCLNEYGHVINLCSYYAPKNAIGYTITEQQPDGTWKIVETTLKASV